MWKNFFYYSRSQRIGLILLLSILTITVAIKIWLPFFFSDPLDVNDPLRQSELELYYCEMIRNDSLQKHNRDSIWSSRRDSLWLTQRDSFRKAVSSKYLKYAKDDWVSYLPVQKNDNAYPASTTREITNCRADGRISTELTQELYINAERIDLNRCDTAELNRIHTVRPYVLESVIRYRDKLGGFVRIEQLLEVKSLGKDEFEELAFHVWIDDAAVKKMYLNKASVSQLRAHPYVKFEQALVIYELRRKKGRISDVSYLEMLDVFDKGELKRLLPYISFD